jgi:predicted NBD/HSP70 family sugar kinase
MKKALKKNTDLTGQLPKLLDVCPTITPPLDPEFRPAILANQNYLNAVKESGKGIRLVIGIERENDLISRFETEILPLKNNDDSFNATLLYVDRLVKFLLWARGGWKLYIGGPREIGDYLRKCYAQDGRHSFESNLMSRIYEKPFKVVSMKASEVPSEKQMESSIGGYFDGCRIGFDLGASDYKVCAVNNGEPIYIEEMPWNPKDEPDPSYHLTHIKNALEKAASFLPRVDAVGGSAAGIYVNNKVMEASIFRSVPEEIFEKQVKPMFLNLGKKWGVPFQVINDGDVTALAGTLSLDKNAMLGIAMGTSEAVGYITPGGRVTGWLNELATAPVDFNPNAKRHEWSGDYGVGAQYFSQAAVDKLARAAGYIFPNDMSLPERLKQVQEKVENGEKKAIQIFETIGIYLGYTIPYYKEFYDFLNLLILGRVTSGTGGDIILARAKKVLEKEFPELALSIDLHVPDEKSRRVGQAVAAASLPGRL